MARLWGWLGALVWAICAGVLAWQLTVPVAVGMAVVAVMAGVLLGPRLASSRVRFSSWWIGLLVVWAVVLYLCSALRRGSLGPGLLGPMGAYMTSECLGWLLLPLATVLVLRASSLRFRSCLVLEVGAVATVLAGIFAGHREGFINRPYFLVDPIWARGWDPLPWFLAIGAGIAAMAIILVATQRSERRSFIDLALLLALVVGIFALLPEEKLKDIPQIRQALSGKNDKQREKRRNQGGSHGQGTPQPGGRDQGGQGQTQQDWHDLTFGNEQQKGPNAPVAVVLLHSDHDPEGGWYYFRQTAFSQFNGQRLVRDTSGRADLDLADYFPAGALNLPHVPTVPGTHQEIDTTVALLTSHTRPFGEVNAETFTSIQNPDPRRFQRAYDVHSQMLEKGLMQLLPSQAGDPSWDESLRQHYLEAPADPRYKALVDRILSQLRPEMRDLPVARAGAIKLWLEKNGVYSLDSRYEDSADPVGDFLFGDRTGYCVFFAHAATYLFRVAGVPARVGAGYAVNARNRGGGSALLVRERDSHAWPEIYLDNVGWVIMDITPEKSIAPPEDPPDAGMQQMLGDMARKGPGNPEDEQQKNSHGDIQELLRKLLRFLWLAFLPLVYAFVACMYALKVYRRIAPYVCAENELPVVAYRAALDVLADVGRVRRFGQTREGFAEQQSGVAPSLPELTRVHLSATLGGRRPGRSRAEMVALYREAARGTAGASRWYRKFIGWLNPFSWWKVK